MRLTLFGVAAILAVFCACGGKSDSPLGSGSGQVASVSLASPGGVSVSIGSQLAFAAAARNASGAVVSGQSFTWMSSDTTVATVSSTGTVTGLAAGIATITVSDGAISAYTAITVSATAAQLSCTGITPLAMNVGDVRLLTGVERSSLCLGGGGGSEYVLIPLDASFDTSTATTTFTLTATNTVAVTNPPSPNAIAGGPILSASRVASRHASSPARDVAFEARLRARERLDLTPKIAAMQAWRAAHARAPARTGISKIVGVTGTPSVGTLIQLNGSLSTCDSPAYHGARIMAVSAHAIVAVDTLTPANGFTTFDYVNFAAAFDTLIYPIDTLNFGVPTDIDGNGHVLLFFSPLVNQLTAPGAPAYVGGFFYARDLFPPVTSTATLAACAGSNDGELFYLPIVDATQQYNGYFSDKTKVTNELYSTIVHEFQHLINAGHHLIINNAPDREQSWLDESLSLTAQELLYFRLAGFAPLEHLDYAAVSTGANANGTELSMFTAYATEQLNGLDIYLQLPEFTTPFDNDENLQSNAAGWEYVRYLLDNSTGAQYTYTRALDNGTVTGIANLSKVFAGAFPNIAPSLQNWAIAQYLNGTGVSSNAAYTYPSWNFRDVVAKGISGNVFPLKIHALLPESPVDLTLRAGTCGFIRFRVNAGITAHVMPAATVSSAVTFALVRTS